MSIGLQIPGRLKSRGLFAKRSPVVETMQRLGDWFEREHELDLIVPPALSEGDGHVQLTVQLLPGTEPVFFTQAAADVVTVSANTGWGGPGYHKHLCEVLAVVSREFKIDWVESEEENDETGYWSNRDWDQLNAELTQWIHRLCEVVVERAGEGMSSIALGLPMDVQFTTPGLALTPIGPKDMAWFEAASHDPELARTILAWTDHDLTATALRAHAIAAMWQEVGWHVPRTERESRVHEYVLRKLTQARQLDARIALPEKEWEELKSYATQDLPDSDSSVHSSRTLIGYRRWPVIMRPFAGWGVTVPGEMSTGEGDDGSVTWFDDERSVHLSTFEVSGDGGSATPEKVLNAAPSADGEVVDTWKHDGCAGKLSVADAESDEGEPYVNFTGLIASRSQLGVCTISASDRAQTEFAKQVCRSITVRDPEE